MITATDIQNRIAECCTHFTFDYNGKCCGVDPFSEDNFDMWCGNNDTTVDSIEKVMHNKFFDGMSLSEIANDIDIINW